VPHQRKRIVIEAEKLFNKLYPAVRLLEYEEASNVRGRTAII
jgi:hypothetical protein